MKRHILPPVVPLLRLFGGTEHSGATTRVSAKRRRYWPSWRSSCGLSPRTASRRQCPSPSPLTVRDRRLCRFVGEPPHKTILQIDFQRFMHETSPMASRDGALFQVKSGQTTICRTSPSFSRARPHKENEGQRWKVEQEPFAIYLAPYVPGVPNRQPLTCCLSESYPPSCLI